MAASRLIEDLNHVPNIIGALGLSIAAAQRAFDANYLDGVERVMALAKMVLAPEAAQGEKKVPAPTDNDSAILKDLITALAPSRYQYTETTLSVRLDLAQHFEGSAEGGLGINLAAVSVNAAFTVGYAFDYRAAAECRTVIHAIPLDANTREALLKRAETLSASALALPDRSKVDEKLIEQTGRIFEKLTGTAAKDLKKPELPAKAEGEKPAAPPKPGT
jgi:hypothetical protein